MDPFTYAIQYLWHIVIMLLIALPAVWLLLKITGLYGSTAKKTIRKFKS